MTTLAKETEGNQPERAGIGDIVKIDGYGNSLFEVVSASTTSFVDMEVEYEYTEYEVLGLKDKRNYLVDDTNVTIVKRAGKGEEGETQAMNYERVDELLDTINDYRELWRVLGDNNNEYANKIELTKLKLKEITGGGD